MKFSDIPQVTKTPSYITHVSWHRLKRYLLSLDEQETPVDIDPVFQREYVWTTEQAIAYVEFKLRGGFGADIIYLNKPGWSKGTSGPIVVVDGKQRLTSVLRFLNDEISAFGHKFSEFEDRLSTEPAFKFAINDIEAFEDVIKWYLELNTGGTVHTQAELNRVKALISQ